MTYIYYANRDTEGEGILRYMFYSAVDKSWMKRCTSLAELSKTLYESLLTIGAVVLIIDNREELEDILSLKDVLSGINVIVILSSQANISPRAVLPLRPRFLTWTDSDLSNVVHLLERMIKV